MHAPMRSRNQTNGHVEAELCVDDWRVYQRQLFKRHLRAVIIHHQSFKQARMGPAGAHARTFALEVLDAAFAILLQLLEFLI